MDHSEDAKVFVLVHKMDLIESPVQKQTVFEAKRQQLEKIATSYEVKVDYDLERGRLCLPESIFIEINLFRRLWHGARCT